MVNKLALRCQVCMVTVHENVCRDEVSECSRLCALAKAVPRPMSLQSTPQLLGRPVLSSLKPPLTGISPLPSPPSRENRKHQNGGTPPRGTPTGPPALSMPNTSSPSAARRTFPSGYSQWRRVATKLGVNKVISEEREADIPDESALSIMDANSASMESLDDGGSDASSLDDDPELRLMDEEPEAWSTTVDKKILKKMKEKDIKRQENIYEFIITEKHHCLTLKVMQKVFAQGMRRELQMTSEQVERIFPRLDDLIEVHMMFLRKLRERQKSDAVVDTIGDLLVHQFQGEPANLLKAAYGEFCSRHTEAVSMYKEYFKSNRKFQNFVKRCSLRPVCKARGIPECILLVTQRITKYPLLIEALIKSAKDKKEEQAHLTEANYLVKEILSNVNAQVAEKEREQRLIDIYNHIDAKSSTLYRGKKFKKSDLLSGSRRLRHEVPVILKQARGKECDVIAIVLSDVVFFLQENSQKYMFVMPDSKVGVLSLQKLLVREKAGQDNRGVYLISSASNEPEMYEVVCHTQKEKKELVEALRNAIENCPDQDESETSETEEERKLNEAKTARLRELSAALHDKDRQLALICEDKMKILGDMLEIVAKEEILEPVHYTHLVDESHDVTEARTMLLAAVQEASRLASCLYVSGTNLSRSVSSAGEHQSEAYVSPVLPKRAETFGGFDSPNKDILPKPVVIKRKGHAGSASSDVLASGLPMLLSRSEYHGSSGSDLDRDGDLLSAKELRRASGPLPTREQTSPNHVAPNHELRRSTLSAGFLPLQRDVGLLSASSMSTLTSGTVSEAAEFGSVGNLSVHSLPGAGNSKRTGEGNEGVTESGRLLSTASDTSAGMACSTSATESPLSMSNVQSPASPRLSLTQSGTVMPVLGIGGPNREQWVTILQLSHYLNTLMCLFSQHFTSYERLRAELLKAQEQVSWLTKETGKESRTRNVPYRHSQQLEELRNLQGQLTSERTAWQKEYESQKQELERQREELTKLQEQVKQETADVNDQRYSLYRQLEMLHRKGVLLGPSTVGPLNLADLSIEAHQGNENLQSLASPAVHRRSWSCDLNVAKDSPSASPSLVPNQKGKITSGATASSPPQEGQSAPRNTSISRESSLRGPTQSSSALPINLYSATNQQRAAVQALNVKQQLPLKLASGEAALGPGQGPSTSAPLLVRGNLMNQRASMGNKSTPSPQRYDWRSGNIRQQLPMKLADENKITPTGKSIDKSRYPPSSLPPQYHYPGPSTNVTEHSNHQPPYNEAQRSAHTQDTENQEIIFF